MTWGNAWREISLHLHIKSLCIFCRWVLMCKCWLCHGSHVEVSGQPWWLSVLTFTLICSLLFCHCACQDKWTLVFGEFSCPNSYLSTGALEFRQVLLQLALGIHIQVKCLCSMGYDSLSHLLSTCLYFICSYICMHTCVIIYLYLYTSIEIHLGETVM